MRRPEIEDLSFEEAVSELDKIVRWLETHDATLDQTIRAAERGTRLRRHAQSLLSEAEATCEAIADATPNRPDPQQQRQRRRGNGDDLCH
jgi:exodeoxyribonuclease VII small subunit